ncbi:MAG: hypothetical protein PHH36_08815 [Sideroxydans sp.]|nr:hypothetical protein [Sideroxydans sp.]
MPRPTLYLLLLPAFLPAFLLAGHAQAAGIQPLASGHKGWQLLPQYSDEFDGNAVDHAKWDDDVAD